MPKNDETRIADAAYHLWLKEGRPEGQDMDHWLRARAELEAAEKPKKRRAAKPKAEGAVSKPRRPAKPRKTPAK